MPYVTNSMDDSGAVVELLIGVSQAKRDALTSVGFNVPARVQIKAVIDSGSHVTGIQPEVLRRLDLTPIDTIPVYTSASGYDPHRCNQFDVSISLAHADVDIEMHLPSVLVIESFFKPEESIQAILGRDVLAHCLFIYDGLHNSYTLAF